ncbi:MAG: hypothetical protein WCF84_17835 [Anaerolineae bacterium]
MKKTNVELLQKGRVYAGFILLFLTGCWSAPTPSPLPLPTPTEIVTPTMVAMLPTVTPSATASPIPPTETPRPATLTPTLTPNLTPTLTANERERRIRELLKTNGGCKLPCWWGITPGQTQWSEAQPFLRALGTDPGNDPGRSGNIFHGLGGTDFGKSGISNDFSFIERNGTVESILIDTEGYYNHIAFQEAWQQFSPRQVITQYGRPSRVLLGTNQGFVEPPGGETMGYFLWLFYDKQGFLIIYNEGVKFAPTYHICPAVQNEALGMSELRMTLHAPDNPTPLEKSYEAEFEYEKYAPRPIQEVAGISVEQFYKLFSQKDNLACFDTPRDIWP